MTCGVLCACAGSLLQSKAPPPAVYLLTADLQALHAAMPSSATAAAPLAPLPVDLAVLRPRIRRGLESDRIAVLYPDRRLDSFADSRWSGPLDEVLEDLTVQAFHSVARLRNVSADSSAFASGYWLEIEVVDFQAEYSSSDAATATAPTVHVRLVARVGRVGDRRVLDSFDADAVQPATANRLTAVVHAYESAVDAALDQIVAATVHAVSQSLQQR